MAAAETRRSLAGHSPPGSPGSGRARRQRAAQRRPRAPPPTLPAVPPLAAQPAACPPATAAAIPLRGQGAIPSRRAPLTVGDVHHGGGPRALPRPRPSAPLRVRGREAHAQSLPWVPLVGFRLRALRGRGRCRAEPTWPWPYWAAVACRPGSLSHGNRSGTQPPVLGGIPRSSPAAGPAGLRRAVLRWGVSSLRAGGSGSLLKCGYVSG